MLGAQFHKSGDLSAVRAAIKRANPEVLYREVFGPFQQWVLRVRIPKMFFRKGQVSGADGQPAWLALSKWTIASKGQGEYLGGPKGRGSVISPMNSSSQLMMRSYDSTVAKTGPGSYRFTLTNKARSTSRWSPGFDYPSALHEGWGPYTVRPRPDGPGFLAWRTQAQTIGASTGRLTSSGDALTRAFATRGLGWELKYSKGKSGKRTGKHKRVAASIDNGYSFAGETHPTGAPARPHIKWFRIDIIVLGDLVMKFVFKGIRSAPTVQP